MRTPEELKTLMETKDLGPCATADVDVQPGGQEARVYVTAMFGKLTIDVRLRGGQPVADGCSFTTEGNDPTNLFELPSALREASYQLGFALDPDWGRHGTSYIHSHED